MNRMPSMIAEPKEVRAFELAGEGFMKMIAMTTANFTIALSDMHGATPNELIRIPAIGGPTTLGALKPKEFKPIAFPMSSRGTSSGTQLCRAGASNDCVAA